MVRLQASPLFQTVLFVGLLPLATAIPHGDENSSASAAHREMSSMNMHLNSNTSLHQTDSFRQPNYFRYSNHGMWMYGHILSMVLAWTILLPLSKLHHLNR
jgi:hypothetical protein